MAVERNEVFLERSSDRSVTSIILNRPQKRNALSPPLLAELHGLLKEAVADDSRVILIRSSTAGIFCAGFDITYLDGDKENTGSTALYDFFSAIEAASKITVAFADGLVVGGGNELFLSCDLRLATARTTFRMTPARLSVVYSYEGLARFMRTVGFTAACELFLAARQISTEEAVRIGLATRIVDDLRAVTEYSEEVALCAPQAQYAMKVMLQMLARDIARPIASESEWHRLTQLKRVVLESQDHGEAVRAFAEKRTPVFKGR
jgi:enoyl-CoA hydratase/carnithine racemase